MAQFSNDWKGSARVAATGNVDLTAVQTVIDSISLQTNDRVLLWKQINAAQNGIYKLGSNGKLTRTTDADSTRDVSSGMTVFVETGPTYGGSYFTMVTLGKVIIGTTLIMFEQKFTSGVGPEVDPIFLDSEAYKLVEGDKAKLDSALQSETDPLFVASEAANLVTGDKDKIDAAIPAIQKGAPNGVATLDEEGLVPNAQIEFPAETDPTYTAQKGVANGAATLGVDGVLTAAQRPVETDPVVTALIGQPSGIATLGADGKVPASQLDLPAETDSVALAQKGAANGIATLGADSKVTPGQLPAFVAEESDPVMVAQKGAANGLATLDANSKIPVGQLPALAMSNGFEAADEAARLAAAADAGEVCYQTDTGKFWFCLITPGDTTGKWKEIATAVPETDPVALGQKGIANGIATLGVDGKVPAEQLPTIVSAEADPVVLAQKGVANGIATLGADGKVPAGQLDLPAETDPVLLAQKAQPNGVATLNGNGKLTEAQRPTETDPTYLAEKGAALGAATLNATGKLTEAQRPYETDPVALAQKGVANGICPLGNDVRIPSDYIPASLAETDPAFAASEAALLAVGDKAKLDAARVWPTPYTAETNTIDWAAGELQVRSVTSATTFTFTGVTAGKKLVLYVKATGPCPLTFPSDVIWSAGTQPVQTANKTDRYEFERVGYSIVGTAVQNLNIVLTAPVPPGSLALSSLIFHYSLDSEMDDKGVRNLTNMNGATFGAGKVGNAAIVGGSKWLMHAANDAFRFDGDGTICFWFKQASASSASLLSYVDSGAWGWWIGSNPAGNGFQIALCKAPGDYVIVNNGLSGRISSWTDWNMIALWRSVADGKLYFEANCDGVIESLTLPTAPFMTDGCQFLIGAGNQAGSSGTGNPTIDQVAKFNYVLSADDRAAWRNSGNGFAFSQYV